MLVDIRAVIQCMVVSLCLFIGRPPIRLLQRKNPAVYFIGDSMSREGGVSAERNR
jgi:hypothetical protein